MENQVFGLEHRGKNLTLHRGLDITGLLRRLFLALRSIFENTKIVCHSAFWAFWTLVFLILMFTFYFILIVSTMYY